jgi:NAD(P)-dependent dehydrogenase (short-subunit alcohol dehydrogenase family)
MTAIDPREFSGKRVLVTGGTKSAGKAIADRFLQGGATVAITARSAPAENTAAHFIQADLSKAEGTAQVMREMLSRFKRVDIIIHNVGGLSAPSGGFITVTDELWQQAIDENLYPAVRLDQASLHDRAGLGRHRSCVLYPANDAPLRLNVGLCRRESSPDQLQQGALE